MNKFGLNLRPQQPRRLPLPKPVVFDDDDAVDVEREISRHATNNNSLSRDIEEKQRKAVEQDPCVFDYDANYDHMKEKEQPRAKERQPKYIEDMKKKAQERKREREIIIDKRFEKERKREDQLHHYRDKDKIITKAYKEKLAEKRKWKEEQQQLQLREEQDDVTKKTDLRDFYLNLGKNVAFGAQDAIAKSGMKSHKLEIIAGTSSVSLQEVENKAMPTSIVEPVSSTSAQGIVSAQQPPAEGNHLKRCHELMNHHDDAAAAKERYLARKRAKEQY